MPPADLRPSLKHPELLILTTLSAGDRHGYGIRQEILDFTDGTVGEELDHLTDGRGGVPVPLIRMVKTL